MFQIRSCHPMSIEDCLVFTILFKSGQAVSNFRISFSFGLFFFFAFHEIRSILHKDHTLLTVNKVNPRILYFSQMCNLFASRLISIFIRHFRMYCVQRPIEFSANFSCRLDFHNTAQRKIGLSTNFKFRLVFPD